MMDHDSRFAILTEATHMIVERETTLWRMHRGSGSLISFTNNTHPQQCKRMGTQVHLYRFFNFFERVRLEGPPSS